jgi:LacI family transcriptional regulator
MRRVTILELAEAAGVSRATVNRVLSGKAKVKSATVEHILKTADSMGFYATSAIRSRLKRYKSKLRFGILLQQETMPFHAELGIKFNSYATSWEEDQISVHVEHMDDLDPYLVAKRLESLGDRCDAVAVATADHPVVNNAVGQLASRQKPVFAVISDLSTTAKAGYVGVDNRQLGRAAGWYASRLIKPGISATMLVGTHRHMCQEQREMGFRMYLREHAPEMELSEVLSFESDQGAFEATLDTLRTRDNQGVIFVVGGGIRGALKALEMEQNRAKPIVISCESTAETRQALLSGLITVVLAHPLEKIAARLTANMVSAAQGLSPGTHLNAVLPFESVISEQITSPRS